LEEQDEGIGREERLEEVGLEEEVRGRRGLEEEVGWAAPRGACVSPHTHTKVAAYLQSLPSPGAGGEGEEVVPLERRVRKEVGGVEDVERVEEVVAVEQSTSEASSRSRASRQSDLGSLTGRMGAGTFYSSLPTATSCPFPEEWQFNTIPEVIENDEDID